MSTSESTASDTNVLATGRVLYVADVAKVLRVGLSAARAFLVKLELQSPGELVHRRGKKLFITEAALAKALSGGAAEPSNRRRVAALDRQVRRLTDRMRALEATVGRLHDALSTLVAD